MKNQTSVVSDAPEAKLEKEHNSKVTKDQPESPDVPASTTEAGTEDPLRVFVALLTVRLLTKCNALQNQEQEQWVAHIKRLVNQTLDGLIVTKGFCPDLKSTKKVCKAVLNDLQEEFGGKRQLESAVLLQDPAVDKVIVQSLQTHIRELSARLVKRVSSPVTWRDVVKLLFITVSTLTLIFLTLLIV